MKIRLYKCTDANISPIFQKNYISFTVLFQSGSILQSKTKPAKSHTSSLHNLHFTPMLLRLPTVTDTNRQDPAWKLRTFTQFSLKPQIIPLILNLFNCLLWRTVHFQFQNDPVCIFPLWINIKSTYPFPARSSRSTRYLLRAER